MNTVEKIRQEFDTMTKSERKIASYFLGHFNDFAFYTLDRISEDIETSTTSILRFCRHLGYRGFKDFQEALRCEVKRNPTLPDKFQHTYSGSVEDDLLAKTIQQGMLCVEKTFSELPIERLNAAVNMLANARRVFTFGLKESYALAHYAYTRMVTVRDDAYMLGVHDGTVEAIHSLTKEDLCVVFLFHRYTRETLHILPMLKKQGVQVLLVTSSPYELLEPYADVIIPCHVNANGIKNSSLAPICLLDYFCNAVAVQAGEGALTRLQYLEELFQTSAVLGS